LRAAKYGRVSTLLQKQHGYSLEAQDQDCDALAAELGATIVASYEDSDSGAELSLPALNAMLDAARRKEFDVLIVDDVDRLARNRCKQVAAEHELRQCGVSIAYVRGGSVEDSPEGRAMSNMRAVFAELEREKIRIRTARGRRAKAESGKVVGNGITPLGYRMVKDANGRASTYAIDPATAPLVRRIFHDVAAHPLQAVADQL